MDGDDAQRNHQDEPGTCVAPITSHMRQAGTTAST
jgi:hypothetical protein